LDSASSWGKFLAILGFIGVGFMVFAGVIMMIGFSAVAMFMDSGSETFSDFGASGSIMFIFMGLFYIALAAVYYFPVNYLYRFSKHIALAVNNSDMDDVTFAFKSLKDLFKFMGVAVIVMFGLYMFFIIIGIIAAIAVPAIANFN